MNINELKNRIEMLEKELTFHKSLLSIGCANCLHIEGTRTCMKWELIVPDDYFKKGCDDWEFDNIPF